MSLTKVLTLVGDGGPWANLKILPWESDYLMPCEISGEIKTEEDECLKITKYNYMEKNV